MNQSGISSEALNHISHPLQEEHLNLGPLLQKQIFSDPPPDKISSITEFRERASSVGLEGGIQRLCQLIPL